MAVRHKAASWLPEAFHYPREPGRIQHIRVPLGGRPSRDVISVIYLDDACHTIQLCSWQVWINGTHVRISSWMGRRREEGRRMRRGGERRERRGMVRQRGAVAVAGDDINAGVPGAQARAPL